MLVKFLNNFDFSNWLQTDFIYSLLKSLSYLNFVLVVNYYASILATSNEGVGTDDLLFNLLPYVNTSFIDKYVAYALSYTIFFLVVFYSKRAIFLLNTVSTLILVRSFFINLTYLGIPEGISPTQSFFTKGGDLFFSGHTALPFVVALVFWDVKYLRYFFLLVTFVMGTQVILGHYHYSIDVFAAPFIAYGVYKFVKHVSEKGLSDII